MAKPDWEITATTIYCNNVDDEVTLLVYADGTSRCTGRQKYARPDKEIARAMKKRVREQRKLLRCLEDTCPIIKQYQDSIFRS